MMAALTAGMLLAAASAWSQPGFVGADSCKLCHRDVYESWRRTPHSSTGTLAADAEARCNACHSTDRSGRLRGVQCEACHGAGEDYSPAEVMIDPDKASMAGLVRPAESVCMRCHDNREPNHQSGFVMPSASAWATSVHVRKRSRPQP
jgi:hypothetical protein